MPKFAIINTDAKTIELHNVPVYTDAMKLVNLKRGEVDFCSIGGYHDTTFHIIVFEFGLMRPKQTTYFRLGTQLFNGNAVIFAADLEGKTVDFPSNIAEHWKVCPAFEWFASASEVEAAITTNRVLRPQSAVNGQVFWSWNKKETLQ
jgi:hypothetical protein